MKLRKQKVRGGFAGSPAEVRRWAGSGWTEPVRKGVKGGAEVLRGGKGTPLCKDRVYAAAGKEGKKQLRQ